jgi:hypothetical protein
MRFITSALIVLFFSLALTFGAHAQQFGGFGMNQILSFMISMPLLIFGWFYFVGWLLDRWSFKRLAS